MKRIVGNIIQFQHRDAGVRAHAVGGGGGGGGGMSSGGDGSDTERRLSRLETSFENVSVALTDLKSDIRLMIGGGFIGGVLLLGAIMSSHLRLQDENDAIIERLTRLEINDAVALTRNDEHDVNRAGKPSAAPDSASSPAGRETLH